MAFQIENLAKTSSGPNAGDNVINVYTYFSEADSTQEILAPGYFNEAFRILHVNDILELCGGGSDPLLGVSQARKCYVATNTGGVVTTDTNLLMGSDVLGTPTNGEFATIPLLYSMRYGATDNWQITIDTKSLVIDSWLYTIAAGGTGAAVHITQNSGSSIIEYSTTPTSIETRATPGIIKPAILNIGDTMEVDYPATQDMATGRLFIMCAASVVL